jgi:hypothetical protein
MTKALNTGCEGYLIDTTAQRVVEVLVSAEYTFHHWLNAKDDAMSLAALLGPQRDNALYVADNALYDPTRGWFQIGAECQPIRGPGIVVGPEDPIDVEWDFNNRPPTISPADLQAMIRFLSWDDVLAWVQEREDKAAVSINGRTIMTWSAFWKDVPPPAPEGQP